MHACCDAAAAGNSWHCLVVGVGLVLLPWFGIAAAAVPGPLQQEWHDRRLVDHARTHVHKHTHTHTHACTRSPPPNTAGTFSTGISFNGDGKTGFLAGGANGVGAEYVRRR